MSCKPDIKTTNRWYSLYRKGLSLQEIANMFMVSRQTVFKRFSRRGLKLRNKNQLPFIEFKGNKYTKRVNGYYAKTDGKRTYLHRDVWRSANYEIPVGYDIHHIDGNRENNRLQNLELIKKDEHARKYPGRKNQFTKEKCGGEIRDCGEPEDKAQGSGSSSEVLGDAKHDGPHGTEKPRSVTETISDNTQRAYATSELKGTDNAGELADTNIQRSR